ncbi:TonB-dependent receptor [Arenibacter algicola]|uniref:SusC/RagA family TonB-linked outer membrane protein n=1 Tax=Arenibacter algicola TaxID=616991 RepID=UPI001C0677DB|nr:TonB-dependent receptor [Arenibacter algicola]MBU2904096.1 TonB-dependent receptor [Arenibacter algicola]
MKKINLYLLYDKFHYNRKTSIALVLFGLLFCINTSAQHLVNGNVVDLNGTPLPGANVVEKGTVNGVTADFDGQFSIEVADKNAILIISYVGFSTNEMPLMGKSSISVNMVEDADGLDEVVVVGYGTVKKADLTGSVSSVDGDDLSRNKSSLKITDAMQGSMAGVTVSNDNAVPGSVGSIRVRGVTTIGDSNPLIIIDGVPGSLSNIRSTDIESISVLKDAAAASIYGSKAAAGVVVITTKRAKSGELSFSYDAVSGYSRPTRLPTYSGATRYMEMVNELIWNDAGNVGTEYPRFAQEYIENYESLNASNPNLYPDSDWNDYVNDFALRQSHTISFSAGQNKVSTRGSVSYDSEEPVMGSNPYKQITARVNNDIVFNKKLTAHLDIQYMNSNVKRPQNTITASLLANEPTEIAYWSDGRVANYRNGENYIARALSGGTNEIWTNEVSGRLALDFTPIDGLKISGIVAPNLDFYKSKDHFLALPMTTWEDPSIITGYVNGVQKTSLSEQRNDSYRLTTQLLINYSKAFGNHSLNALGGYENFTSFNEQLSASRQQYDLDNFPYLDLGPIDLRDNSGTAWEYASRSYFGRIDYNYKSKYLIQANARYDGSARFGKGHRWGLFPSLSAGWVVSEESFLKDFTPISFLKFRASWGTLGNERIGNYPYQATLAFTNALFYNGSNVSASQAAYVPRFVVPDISWETTRTVNFGIDASFLDNKLSIVADYYKKKTSDMLLPLEIPDYIGLDNPNQNTGLMDTKGWDLAISYNNNIGDFYYKFSGNVSDSRTRMGDLGGTQFLGDLVKYEGSEFDEWFGYKAEGLYQTADEVANSATINNRVQPGDVKYTDISGPDGIPDGVISPEYDKVLLGGSLPRFEYGGNLFLRYKNFDFNLVVYGIGQQNKYLNTLVVEGVRGGALGSPAFVDGNYWSTYNSPEENANAFYPRLSSVAAGGTNRNNGNNYVTSDYWLINGGFLRVKNLVLGWSLPDSIIEKLKIQDFRIYGNVTNPFSIDKFPEGWDPQFSSSGYFVTKSFALGISIKL